MFKRVFFAIIFFPCLLAAAGPEVLRIGCLDFPSTLNPVYATSETAQGIVNKLHRALFYFDLNGVIRPELAAAVRWDEKRLAITITLKRNARFANGAAVCSRDVLATWALLSDPLFEYPYLSDLSFIAGIVAIDPLNFCISLKAKYAPWKNYLTFKILHANDIVGMDPVAFRKHRPLGCGPYQLQAVEEAQSLLLSKNPFYPFAGSYKRVSYSVLGDPRQSPLKLLRGELDAVDVQADEVRAHGLLPEWRKRFSLLKYRKFGYTYLVFNLENPAVDLNLRRLFYNCLHVSPFLRIFLRGSGQAVYSPFLGLSTAVTPKRLPAVSPSKRRHLRILANSESVLRKQLVLFLCEEMKRFNIELEPVFVEYQAFLKYLKQRNYDLAVSAFLLDMDWNLKDVLSSSGYFNYAGLADMKMDALLESGLREMNEEERRQIYLHAHERWRELLPLIPLFNLDYHMGVSRFLKVPAGRFRMVGSTGDFFYNLSDW